MNKQYCVRYHLTKFDGIEVRESLVKTGSVDKAIGCAYGIAKRLAKKYKEKIVFCVLGEDVNQIGVVEL